MRYGKIKDTYMPWVRRKGLSVHAGLLGVYALSCPHSNLVGCYRLPAAYLIEDLGWPPPQVKKALAELVDAGFLQRDETTGWTRVVGFFDHNPIANPKVGKAAMPYIAAVPPEVPFYADFIAELRSQAHRFPAGFVDEMASRRNGMANGIRSGIAYGFHEVRKSETETEAEAEAETETEQNNPATGERADIGFEDFYKAFPKRVDRGRALKQYRIALKKADGRTLLAGAQRYAQQCAGKDPRYIAHPASWLSGERWLDEPSSLPGVPIANAVDWDKACATFKELQHWPSHAGDRPGLPGCKCPTDVLARHGLQHREAA